MITLLATLQRPKATMPYKPGFEEDGFLRSLAPFEAKEIELKADNCTKVTCNLSYFGTFLLSVMINILK